jgi:neurofibromin 1
MAPWLPALRTHVLATEIDSEKARDKIANIFQKLIAVAMSNLALSTTLEQCVWPAISCDELQTEILLDELIKAALGSGMQPLQNDVFGSIVSSLKPVTVRGKIVSRLRKALNRSSLRPTRHLPDNAVWDEICLLLRLCLSLSFNSGVQSHLYLPELFHVVTMLANVGSFEVRSCVYQLLVNTIHALCTNFVLEEIKLARIRIILGSLSETNSGAHHSAMGVARDRGLAAQAQELSGTNLLGTESLATVLAEIASIAAPSTDLANVWRSRWMSLVASTAFQSNPAIQPRAFTVMGCLAREDVDDDLLYQVLVALRNSVGRFVEDNDMEMLVAIVNALAKMMEKLPMASRYGLQLFWLAISLVRLVPLALFNCASLFLEAVLINISTSGDFRDGRMVYVLLQGRSQVEEPATQLDECYGVHFNAENFHFAVCASLVKGLTDNSTKRTTLRVLTTFLEITSGNAPENSRFPEDLSYLPYLGMVMSRALTSEEARDTLWLAGISSKLPGGEAGNAPRDFLSLVDLDTIRDKELLLNAAISLVDFAYLEDSVQNLGLLWLNQVALRRPNVILHL